MLNVWRFRQGNLVVVHAKDTLPNTSNYSTSSFCANCRIKDTIPYISRIQLHKKITTLRHHTSPLFVRVVMRTGSGRHCKFNQYKTEGIEKALFNFQYKVMLASINWLFTGQLGLCVRFLEASLTTHICELVTSIPLHHRSSKKRELDFEFILI